MLRWIAILWLLWAVPAEAEWPYDAVANLSNGNTGGSATLVAVDDQVGLLLSCAHVFEDGVRKPYVTFPDGQKFYCSVLAIDRQKDLSALAVRLPKGIYTPTQVRPAKAEDKVFLAVGYPFYGRDKAHWTTGEFLSYDDQDCVQFRARPYVHSGFSGGALFAQDGSFVGVVCGYGSGYSYASSGRSLTEFAGRWMKCGQ